MINLDTNESGHDLQVIITQSKDILDEDEDMRNFKYSIISDDDMLRNEQEIYR